MSAPQRVATVDLWDALGLVGECTITLGVGMQWGVSIGLIVLGGFLMLNSILGARAWES